MAIGNHDTPPIKDMVNAGDTWGKSGFVTFKVISYLTPAIIALDAQMYRVSLWPSHDADPALVSRTSDGDAQNTMLAGPPRSTTA